MAPDIQSLPAYSIDVPYNTIYNELSGVLKFHLKMCFGRGRKNSFSKECHICVVVNDRDRRFAWASCSSQQRFRQCAHAGSWKGGVVGAAGDNFIPSVVGSGIQFVFT